METEIELPDGNTVTLEHEGELTDDAIRNAVSQMGYDMPMSRKDLARNILGEGTRVAGAVAGGIRGSKAGPWGAVVGAGLGALLAEAPARMITPREETLGESAANVALGFVNPASKAATLPVRLARGAALGAGLGVGHTLIQTGIDEKRLPTMSELAPSVGAGAGVGAVLEGILGPRAAKAGAAIAQEAKPSITSQLDQKKPSTLEGSNAQANEIAMGGKGAGSSTQATPSPAPSETASVPIAPEIDTPSAASFVMPKELAGAKPRYAYGSNQFGLEFESDLDRALYILAQSNPSKRDADYLAAVVKQTGMTEQEARAAGRSLRDKIKTLAKDSDEEILTIPDSGLFRPKKTAKAVRPSASSASEPPVIVAADDDAAIEAAAAEQNRVAVDDDDAIDAALEAQKPKVGKKVAPAEFIGVQEGIAGNPKFPDRDLYNLTEDIPGHPKDSSVFGSTLEEKGYTLPKKTVEAPAVTETPMVKETYVKAKGRAKPSIVEDIQGPIAAKLGDEPVYNTRNLAKRVIDSDIIPIETREALKSDPSILYERHKHRGWMDQAESATDAELNQMIAEATHPDQGVLYRRELSNRLIAQKKYGEAAEAFAGAAKLTTPGGRVLAAARMIRTAMGDLHEVEEVAAKASRNLTKEQKEKVLQYASREIEAQKKMNALEKRAKEFFNKDNLNEYREAQQAHAEAKMEFDEYVASVAPRELPDMIVKVIQGNLLTPLSIASNVFGNLFWAPLERASMSVSSAMDAIVTSSMKGLAKAAGKDPKTIGRSISAGNPLPSQLELAAMGDGVRTATKELLTGPSQDSYVKAEIQRGFRPLQSLIDSVTGSNLPVDEAGNIAKWDRTKAFIEGTLGVPPEVMFRLLSIGDKPFRRAATVRAYLEQARLKGVKDTDLERFMALPDAKTKEMVEKATRRSIFAEENAGITTLNRFLDSDLAKLLRVDKIPVLQGAVKVFGRLTVPFRQFPVNYALTALNFAAPHLAMAKSAYYGYQSHAAAGMKNLSPALKAQKMLEFRRKSLTNLGEAAMGLMMYSAAEILWDNGLISESVADTAAKRSDQSEAMGAAKLNVDGLDRYLNGQDPAYKKGDKLVDWTRAGIPAVIFHIYTEQQARAGQKEAKAGSQEAKEPVGRIKKLVDNAVTSAPGLGSFIFDQSFLAGTSSLLEAIKDADPESPKFQNWMGNMWKAITSIPVPNTVDAVARAQMEYVPELRGKDAYETLGNIWRHKTFQLPADDRPLILKRDTWGRPIKRTPEGANPYVYGLVDVTKSGRQLENSHDQALYDLYKETGRDSIYPDPVGRSLEYQGTAVELDPEDVEKMQEIIGTERRNAMESFVDSRLYQRLDPMERVLGLESLYREANNQGRQKFLTSSGIYKKYFSSDPEKRTTSRSTEAILRGN